MLLFSSIFPEKDAKNSKIFQKRVLTIEREGDIIIKRAAERSQRVGKSGQRTLKTIQRKEERTTVNSGMSFTCWTGEPEHQVIWIKHKSLILAQDERWRRA